ncbi:MAG: internal scaffolding protein [Microviridae sp.]|nr:MAG: internal scaffolding protein [Microviridae sp.]
MYTLDGELMPTFVRSPYNYDRDAVSRETGLACPPETRTQQQFRDECDINVILERFGVTGQLPLVTVQPMAGDFTGIDDYKSAVDTVMAAEENFMALPAKVREKFGQDPNKFVDFCLDPANIEAVREMGLAPRPPQPTLVQLMKEKENGGTAGAQATAT